MGLKVQVVERALVPTMIFAPEDVVVTVGPDGLVANCAKYAGEQPILAVNPEPARFDGILLPFKPGTLRAALTAVLEGRARLRLGERSEPQSSSGLIVSNGAGSTGWLSSMFNMAAGVERRGGERLDGLQRGRHRFDRGRAAAGRAGRRGGAAVMERERSLAGVLLGTALGDALALPMEGLSAAAVARRFGRVDRFHLLCLLGDCLAAQGRGRYFTMASSSISKTSVAPPGIVGGEPSLP